VSSFFAAFFLAGAFFFGAGFSRSLRLVVGHQLFLGHRLVRHINDGHQVINGLFFKDRGTQRSHGTRCLLEIFVDFLLLAGELANLFEQRALQFFVADLDAGLFTDLRQNQSKTDPALGQCAVFFARGLLGGVLVGKGLAVVRQFLVDLAPDAFEFRINQFRRRVELVRFIELVEDLPLQLLPRYLAILVSRSASLTISRSLSADSRPSDLASSSLISSSPGAATALTLMSKVASLPAR
jgi:hypothetical protein